MAANNDIDINIVQEAKLALTELEKIIYPVAPTLQIPRQQEPDNDEFTRKLDKRSLTKEELPEDIVSCKQPKIITSKCADIISSENTTKLMEMNNSMMDIDKSQEDENLCEKEETGNILKIQEQDKIHYNKEENQHNIDEIVNSTTESKAECKLIAYVNIEKKELKENLISCTNKTDKRLEEISLKNLSATTKKVYMEMNDPENQEEELSINSRDSPDPFQDVDWHD